MRGRCLCGRVYNVKQTTGAIHCTCGCKIYKYGGAWYLVDKNYKKHKNKAGEK